jgi:branched-chain amino acid transport system substrate-binding protein
VKLRNTKRALFVILIAMFLAACSGKEVVQENDQSGEGAKTSAPEAYKIGAVLPLTGGEAAVGKDMVTAFKMGIESINKAGGINGVPMELIAEDSAADPNRSITAYRKIVDVDEVPILISAWSSVINAMAPLAEQDKTLLLSVGAGSPNIAKLGEYTRTTSVLGDTDMEQLAKYSYKNKGAKKAAIIYISNDSGKLSAEAYRDAFTKLGGKVVAFESHAPKSTDFSAQLSKIKASNPDIIHIQSLIDETPFIIRQIKEMGIKAQLTTYSGVFGEGLIKNAGEQANGILGTSFAPDADYSPEIKEYIERWQNEQGREPAAVSLISLYTDAPYLVKDIIEKLIEEGKEVNGENARKALMEIKEFNLPINGKTIFNEDGTVLGNTVINQIVDGQVKTIEVVEPE